MLLLGLIHGMIYIRLIPPWQHYDEPGHVEFAWLIADRLHIPREGDYDQAMRREMAASMIEFDFFEGLDFRPNLLSQDESIWIGHAQVFGLPLYYAYLSFPLRLFQYTDITFQLYLARYASLILYLVTLVAAYGIVRAVTPPEHPLRWMVPFSLALLPGFVDLMTAVNDDVGATAAFTLFLWAGLLIIRKGFSWLRGAALALTTAACALTKNTVVVAIILSTIPVLIRIFRNVRRRYLWAGIALSGLLLVLTAIRMEDAAAWHRDTNQRLSTNALSAEAPVGRESFQFNGSKGVFQIMNQGILSELGGKTVTLGAWMWADNPIQLQTPAIYFNSERLVQSVGVSRKPAFHAFSAMLPEDLTELLITINPGGAPEKGGRVYYDGIILVEGDYSTAGAPIARDMDANQVEWDGTTLNNYIRNASAERSWFVIRPVVDRIMEYYVPGSPDLYLSLLQDWRSATWYYQLTFENLHQTFWGKFGWGHVPLLGGYSYPILALLSLIGLAGAILFIIRQWHQLPLNAYLFLFISGLVIWLFTILRGLTSIMDILFIPSARYAYPVIVPTVLALNMGWYEIWYRLFGNNRPRVWAVVYILSFVLLYILALTSILDYYDFG